MHLLLRMMMRMLMLMPDPSVSVCSGDVRSVGRGGVGLGAPVFPGAGAGDRGCTSGGGGPSEGGFCWLCKNLHSSTPPGKNHCSAAILTQAAQAGGESSKSVVQHCSSETIGSADNTGESANPGETDAMRVLLEWIICCCAVAVCTCLRGVDSCSLARGTSACRHQDSNHGPVDSRVPPAEGIIGADCSLLCLTRGRQARQ